MENFQDKNFISIFNIILGVAFFIGLFSNILVLIFLLCFDKLNRQKTKNLMLNLAIVDLLIILLCIPIQIHKNYKPIEWPLGDIGCRLSAYIQGVVVTVSVLTITIISIDRYLIISKPFIARRLYSNRKVGFIILVVWGISFILNIPLFIVTQNKSFDYSNIEIPHHFSICYENWTFYEQKLAFELVNIVLLLVMPTFIISYTCIIMIKNLLSNRNDLQAHRIKKSVSRLEENLSRTDIIQIDFVSKNVCKASELFLKKQETKVSFEASQSQVCTQLSGNMNDYDKYRYKRKNVALFMIILLLLFIISWLPYHTIYFTSEILLYFDLKNSLQGKNTASNAPIIEFINKNIHPYTTCLAFSNSALNGILFCIFSTKFRKLICKFWSK